MADSNKEKNSSSVMDLLGQLKAETEASQNNLKKRDGSYNQNPNIDNRPMYQNGYNNGSGRESFGNSYGRDYYAENKESYGENGNYGNHGGQPYGNSYGGDFSSESYNGYGQNMQNGALNRQIHENAGQNWSNEILAACMRIESSAEALVSAAERISCGGGGQSFEEIKIENKKDLSSAVAAIGEALNEWDLPQETVDELKKPSRLSLYFSIAALAAAVCCIALLVMGF